MLSYCRSITNITIPDNVTKIEDEAFSNIGITNIDLNNVEYIGRRAFASSQLQEINLNNIDGSNKEVKVPLLSDVFIWGLVNNIKFNVEIKPYYEDRLLVENTIKLVKKYHLEDRVVLTSSKYNILEEIKEIDNKIATGYIMSFAYGDILKLDKADNFSIEASSINKELVKNLHNSGKEVYAWTVNSKDSINKMLDLNVDNIITDDVDLARKLLFESKSSNLIFLYLKWIERIFR